MGTSSSKSIDVTKIDLSEWKQVGIHREMSKIVQNTNGKGIAQLQTITFDPKKDIQKQLNIYQYRKTSNNALVKCLGVLQQKVKSPSICGSSHVLKVLTQRIPFRLNQLPQLSFPETLYTLSQSLRGYKDCYNKLGPFDVDDQMIGINQQGDVKVWVHQNFAQNHPYAQRPLLQTSGSQIHPEGTTQSTLKRNDETEMVSNIIQVIEKKNQFGRYPQEFAQTVYRKNLGFDEAFKEIESFSKAKNIFVPDRLQSVSTKMGYGVTQIQTTIDRSSENTAMNPARQLFADQRTSVARSDRVFSPIIYDQGTRRIAQNKTNAIKQYQTNRVTSPIKILFQQPDVNEQIQSPRRELNSPPAMMMSPRTQAVGSKVTFRLVSPESSTLSFQKQNSQFFNRI